MCFVVQAYKMPSIARPGALIKANRQFAFIKQNLLSQPQDLNKSQSISQHILHQLNHFYSCTVWNTHISELIKQTKSVMWIHSRYSSLSSKLTSLGWETLELRHKVNRLALMHRINNNQVVTLAQTFLHSVVRPTILQNNKAFQRPSRKKEKLLGTLLLP